MKKRIWQWMVRSTFYTLLTVLKYVPWKLALAFGTAIGSFGYVMSARYRKVADKNLRLAYGDSMTEAGRRSLTKRVFQHFSRMALIECLKACTMSPDEIRKIVVADSYAYVDELLARGKGMILITGHFGNWELLARRAALEGYHFVVVARQSPDAAFNALTDRLREGAGYTVHPRGSSPKAILQTLRSGGVIAILPDQKSDDVFVPFFGEVAGTVAGPAVLALKTGAPILPMFCPRQPDGAYRMVLKPEIDIRSSGNAEADVDRIMRDINLVIEEMVRAYPDQWLWLHDRWKIRPKAETVAPARGSNNENAVTTTT